MRRPGHCARTARCRSSAGTPSLRTKPEARLAPQHACYQRLVVIERGQRAGTGGLLSRRFSWTVACTPSTKGIRTSIRIYGNKRHGVDRGQGLRRRPRTHPRHQSRTQRAKSREARSRPVPGHRRAARGSPTWSWRCPPGLAAEGERGAHQPALGRLGQPAGAAQRLRALPHADHAQSGPGAGPGVRPLSAVSVRAGSASARSASARIASPNRRRRASRTSVGDPG